MNVSVVIPAYQHGDRLAACLDSLLAQTRPPLEIVVVDDGSTDATPEVLKRYEGRVKAIRQARSGAAAARNRGFEATSGEAVLFCDADAVVRRDAVAKLAAALERDRGAAFAYASFRFGWKLFRLWPWDPERLKRFNFVHTNSLIRRAAFPGFDESLKRFQDWDLWLTVMERGGRGVWVPETLFRISVRKGGISSWLPSFMYRLPWRRLGFAPKRIRDYEAAAGIVRRKHHLP